VGGFSASALERRGFDLDQAGRTMRTRSFPQMDRHRVLFLISLIWFTAVAGGGLFM